MGFCYLSDEVLVLRASGHNSEDPGFHARNERDKGHSVSGMAVGVVYSEVPGEGVFIFGCRFWHVEIWRMGYW